MHIYLAGRGNMATEMEKVCASREVKVTRMGDDFDYSNPNYGKPIAVHFGSQRRLLSLIDTCERMKIPLIQGSTKVTIPSGRNLVIVNAPNLSIPMIRFLAAFRNFAKAIRPGMDVTIAESHQSTKPDKSGTARAIAEELGIAESQIGSVRDPIVQRALGVPKEHLDGHAYHFFDFTGQGVNIRVSTKIHGRGTYAEGALTLAHAITCQVDPLKNGIYELKDILHLLPN